MGAPFFVIFYIPLETATMTLLATTELEAVNMMLSAIAEAQVATLNDDTIEDAQTALTILRQVSRELQNPGWHINTEYDYPLSVDSVTNKIPYPVTALHVDAMPCEQRDIVKRGAYLYDRSERTFEFTNTTSLKCKITWALDFEDLPQSARTAIALIAARRFAEHVLGDDRTVSYAREDAQKAMTEFIADDMRRGDHNMLRDSYSVSRILRGRLR
jgi:hypothetical protein